MLLKITLLSLGSGEAPLLDIVAYAGYTFTGLCLAVLGKIIWGYSYYVLIPWTCLCTGVFLVKTMKRVLFAESRSYDSSRHHYLLIFVALAQFPLLIWLGNISVNWLFWNALRLYCCEKHLWGYVAEFGMSSWWIYYMVVELFWFRLLYVKHQYGKKSVISLPFSESHFSYTTFLTWLKTEQGHEICFGNYAF